LPALDARLALWRRVRADHGGRRSRRRRGRSAEGGRARHPRAADRGAAPDRGPARDRRRRRRRRRVADQVRRKGRPRVTTPRDDYSIPSTPVYQSWGPDEDPRLDKVLLRALGTAPLTAD